MPELDWPIRHKQKEGWLLAVASGSLDATPPGAATLRGLRVELTDVVEAQHRQKPRMDQLEHVVCQHRRVHRSLPAVISRLVKDLLRLVEAL